MNRSEIDELVVKLVMQSAEFSVLINSGESEIKELLDKSAEAIIGLRIFVDCSHLSLKEEFDKWTDEARLNFMRKYCKSCGGKSPRCNCDRDD